MINHGNYTGIIYEAITLDESIGVGSIAAGGKYGNLIGMFSGEDIPAVGFSIGIERIMAILLQKSNHVVCPEAHMMLLYRDRRHIPHCLEIVATLRQQFPNMAIDYAYEPFEKSKRLGRQLGQCDNRNIPCVIILGLTDSNSIIIKDMRKQTQHEGSGTKFILDKIKDILQ